MSTRRRITSPAALALTLTMVTLYVSLTAAGNDRSQASAEADAAALRGIWATVVRSVGGVIVPKGPTDGPHMMAFDRGSYLHRQGERIVEEGTYVVDARKSPPTIDFSIKKGPDAGQRGFGIFALEGDELKLCLAEPGARKRPKELEPKIGSACLVVVCRRYRP